MKGDERGATKVEPYRLQHGASQSLESQLMTVRVEAAPILYSNR